LKLKEPLLRQLRRKLKLRKFSDYKRLLKRSKERLKRLDSSKRKRNRRPEKLRKRQEELRLNNKLLLKERG